MPPKKRVGLSVFNPCVIKPVGLGPAVPTRADDTSRSPRRPIPSEASSSATTSTATLPLLASRKDTPFIRSDRKERGSLQKALAACKDEESKELAIQEYDDRTRATSAHGTSKSLWKTWVAIHEEWFGTGPSALPVLPLEPCSIKAVVSALIKGGYRSAPNYVSMAKDKHTEFHQWTSMLEREQHKANRASTRGLGPSHQCAELPVLLAYKAAGDILGKPGDPVGIRCLIVIASFFVLREIEVSLLLVRCVSFDWTRSVVSILLPATKTDPSAHSVTRQWGCVCSGNRDTPCPFHELAEHINMVADRFGTEGIAPPSLPLFPDENGEVITKEHMTDLIERLAVGCELPVTMVDGRPCFGGHVWRISGARHLARLGVPYHIIKLLARWQSDIIDRYLKDVPLERLTAAYLDGSRQLHAVTDQAQQVRQNASLAICDSSHSVVSASTSSSSSSGAPGAPPARQVGGRTVGKGLSEEQVVIIINRALRPLQDLHETAQKNVSSLAMDLVRARDSIKMLEARSKLPFLCSDGLSGSYHVTMGDYQLLPKSSWITTCGWRYGHSNFTRALKVPAQVPRSRVCARCLPDTIAQSMGVLCDVE